MDIGRQNYVWPRAAKTYGTPLVKIIRNVCKLGENGVVDDEQVIIVSQNIEEDSLMDISQSSVNEISFLDNFQLVSTPRIISTTMPATTTPSTTISTSTTSGTISSTSLSSYPSTSSLHSHSSEEIFKPPTSNKGRNLKSYIDAVSKKEEADISESIAQFFFGCNIPFNVIESDLFKNIIKKLRPSYYKSIPSRKVLSNSLLESEYKKEIEKSKQLLGKESVMLIDGWKNRSSNTKIVVTMLHNANGNRSFLKAYNFSIDSETGENLATVVEDSINLAANMLKMGKLIHIWHINCSAHVANLWAKDVVDMDLAERVKSVMSEFRNTDLEKIVLEKGGSKMKMPCDTRWNSYRDCFLCLTRIIQYMRECVIEARRKIKQQVKNLLFDDIFLEDVELMVSQLNPISGLLNKVQSADCNGAECANLWLYLAEPDDSQLKKKFKERRDKALNIYFVTSYYLHPFFENHKLSACYLNSITSFLIECLDGTGLYELDLFLEKRVFPGYTL